jgi:hypothetical protein
MCDELASGMLFVIVTVRFFDYDYDYAHEHEHESGNPGVREVRKSR